MDIQEKGSLCGIGSSPLAEELRKVVAGEKISFHMPGHSAGQGFSADFTALLAQIDTTELSETDNLHHPTGMLQAAQERAARFFGAKRSYFLVNGSTVGLLAMIQSTAGYGETLLIGRDCHQSVLHALQLAGVQPCFVETRRTGTGEIPCGPTIEALKQAIALHPQARGLLVTRPNYYGMAVSLTGLADLLHSKGMLLLVDEAHGAHFIAHPQLPEPALAVGADLVVQSLHKTLPAPTQTAILHEGPSWPGVRPGLPVSTIQEALSLFQTTSPSFPLLACIDATVSWASGQGLQAYDRLLDRIGTFRDDMAADRRYRFSAAGNAPSEFSVDPTRMVIITEGKGIELEIRLRKIHGIVAEMADRHRVVLIATPFHTAADFKMLSDALKQAPEDDIPQMRANKPEHMEEEEFHVGSLPECRMALGEAVRAPHEQVLLRLAVGRVAARAVAPYPPGVAVIIPGERYESARVKWLSEQVDSGISIPGIENGCVSCIMEIWITGTGDFSSVLKGMTDREKPHRSGC